jgi:amino acid transporter
VIAAPPRELGLRDLVLFNIAAVVSIRWLATAAHIGPLSLLLWTGAALLFFLPLALSVATLTARFPSQGGIYVWTAHFFGPWHGFLCGWCYWLSNLFFFPNLLVAGIAIALYMFGPEHAALSDNPRVVLPLSLAVLWIASLANVIGLRVGKWINNIGAAATCAGGTVLIAAAACAAARDGSATRFGPLPAWDWGSLNYWPQIAFAFGGLELGAILSGEIRDPSRTVRRAAWISGAAIAGLYILGTSAILALLPPEGISVVTGLAQAGASAAGRLGLPWLTPALAFLIALGVIGQLGAWLSGGARLAFAIGLDRYLPESFGRLHPRWRTPYIALLTQGAACTLFLLAMQSGETLRMGYQILVDITVIAYFIPFLYLFAAAARNGQVVTAAAGLLVTAAAIAFSFVPPDGVRSVWLFEIKITGSLAILIAAAWLSYRRARLHMRG